MTLLVKYIQIKMELELVLHYQKIQVWIIFVGILKIQQVAIHIIAIREFKSLNSQRGYSPPLNLNYKIDKYEVFFYSFLFIFTWVQ